MASCPDTTLTVDTCVLLPPELSLVPSSGSLWTSQNIVQGTCFYPFQGTVRLESMPLQDFLPASDVRHRYGCYEAVTSGPSGEPVRHCNWVRFLSPSESLSTEVNVVATKTPLGHPVFRVLKDLAPGTQVKGYFDEGGEQQDTEPLDLSKSPKTSTVTVQRYSRRARERTLLPCDVCGKAFDRPSLLKRHMRTHTGEKPHVCEVCSKGFSTSSSLNTHRRIHSGEKPHQCGVCGKRFTASSNLYYHRMTHSKEKPHKCPLCLKSFPTPGDLKSHMYVHSGCWPFKCHVCSRGFSKQTNLRNHLFLHTGDKPHPCHLCGKKFALACNLRAHLKTHEEQHKLPMHVQPHPHCATCIPPLQTPSLPFFFPPLDLLQWNFTLAKDTLAKFSLTIPLPPPPIHPPTTKP